MLQYMPENLSDWNVMVGVTRSEVIIFIFFFAGYVGVG